MLLIVDANVLIDYASADVSILALVVQYVGPVYVARDVLDEVRQIDEATCTRLGLLVAEGTLKQAVEAGKGGGGLSYADRMCLVLARDHGWVCVTNDRRLRGACEARGVEVRWGLQMMLDVVHAGGMEAQTAIEVAETIGRLNPWIRAQVIERFVAAVRRAGR